MSILRLSSHLVQAKHSLKCFKYEESLINNFCSQSVRDSLGVQQSRELTWIAGVPLCQQVNFLPYQKCNLRYSTSKASARSVYSLKRSFHSSERNQNEEDQDRQFPRLLYIQSPLVWFANKMDFRYLRTRWDPHFTEAEFTRGARQAVSKITELISRNMFDSMKKMLTMNAFVNLRKDIEVIWGDEIRRNIALKPEDVQLIIPRKLYFRNVKSQRFCDIDMVFIGLKWLDTISLKQPPLLFVDIFGRFHRNYSEGINPEWTVALFKLRRFNVMPPKKKG